MNAGQMLEDVRLAIAERVPIHFYGRMGGAVPMPEEIVSALRQMLPMEVLS
jgi:2-oxoglutarate ferredoxin oxidoreductase subunit alpha